MAIVPQIIQFGGGGISVSRNIDSTDLRSAFSLSRLRDAYIGDAIRVRRSSDNVEQDIGFSGQNLDETELLNFVGTGGTDNGFVVTWYDQGGQEKNAIQATTAKQPQIVSNGSIIKVNGKTAIQFDGTDDKLESNFGTSGYYGVSDIPTAAFVVLDWDGGNEEASVLDINRGNNDYIFNIFFHTNSSNVTVRKNSSFVHSGTTYPTSQALLSMIHTGTATSLWQNGSNIVNNASQNVGTMYCLWLGIGNWGSATNEPWNGTVQEVLVYYPTDKGSVRTSIETNINNYYSIYT